MEDQARVNRTWLLDLLDEAFDRKSWHGANLRGSIRALTPAVAAWRPAEGRHNIWELVVHAAYWKERPHPHRLDSGHCAHDLYHAGQIQLIKRLALQNATPSL
ncbi:MAG: hypothetical protein LC791_18490 [Acidobacteria bacterium]|nr:hypothetical protein [Acidobacteriota bacterium]